MAFRFLFAALFIMLTGASANAEPYTGISRLEGVTDRHIGASP
jgi:hypothetical protein